MESTTKVIWPSGWIGESVIDCGANGRLQAQLVTDGDLTPVHREIFTEIVTQWSEIWEVVEDLVTGMAEGCDDLPELRNPHAKVIISLPSQHISPGVSWSVAVEFPDHGSTWNVAFDGWDYSEDGTQPIY